MALLPRRLRKGTVFLSIGVCFVVACTSSSQQQLEPVLEWQYGRKIQVVKGDQFFWPEEAEFSVNPDIILVHCVNETTAWMYTQNGRLTPANVSHLSLHVSGKAEIVPRPIVIDEDIAGIPFKVGDIPFVINPSGAPQGDGTKVFSPIMYIGPKRIPLSQSIGRVFDVTTIKGIVYVLTSKGLYSVDERSGGLSRVLELYGHTGFILAGERVVVIDSNYSRLAVFGFSGKLLHASAIESRPAGAGSPRFWDFTLGPERKSAFIVYPSGHILSSEGVLYETGTSTLIWQHGQMGVVNPCLVDDRFKVIYVFEAPGSYGSIPYREVAKPELK